MMLKLIAGLLAVPVALLGVVAGTGVMVVDVRESGGPHIVVPVPLLAAQVAASLAPAEKTRVDLAEAEQALPAAREMVRALAQAPDGELVRVEEREEQVTITKKGDLLQIRVQGREQVAVDVPLSVVSDVLDRARDGHLTAADIVGALRHARLTRLAEVQDGGDHVKVTIW